MQNKLIRLCKYDALLLLRLAAIGVMVLSISIQVRVLVALRLKSFALAAEQTLVSNVKKMERELEERRDGTAKQFVKGAISFEGVLREKNIAYAIIDSKVYQEGQVIRDYQIKSITDDSVVLENIKTQEEKVLQLNIRKP